MLNQTGKLQNIVIDRARPRDTDTLDLGAMRPWRISMLITQLGVQLIFDLSGQMLLGRRDLENNSVPHVDLSPFRAEELGVSRGHLSVSLEGNTVMIVDNQSLNGTFLNGKPLQSGQPYMLRNGDELMLGMMTMQVELLVNPLDQ